MSGKLSKKGPASKLWEAAEVPLNVIRPSGRKLDGTLTYPSGESQTGPVVIFLHGTMSNRDHNFVPDLCKKLVKEHGLRSYRFDFRFDHDEFEPDHRYKFSGYNDDIEDLECVIRTLRMEGFTPFCLFGHSRGANDAFLYGSTRTIDFQGSCEGCAEGEHHHRVQSAVSVADMAANLDKDDCKSSFDEKRNYARDDDVSHLLDSSILTIVAAAPRFNMPGMLPALFSKDKIDLLGQQESFVWESQRGELTVTRDDAKVVMSEMDMAAVVKSIPDCVPILLLHGTDDELIPCDDAQNFKCARESIDLTIVEGARHAFRGKKQLKQLLTVCSDWLGTKLQERGLATTTTT